MVFKKNEYFYLKEILLGLRSEYQSLQSELNSIASEYVGNEKCIPYIVKRYNDTCLYLKKEKNEKELARLIKLFLNLQERGYEQTLVSYSTDNKRNYVYSDVVKNMDAEELNDFFNDVDIALNRNIVTNTSNHEIPITSSNGDSYDLEVSPSGIYLAADKLNLNAGGVGVSYDASSDKVSVWPYTRDFKPFARSGGIQEMLDVKIPYDSLNPYIVNTVKNNPDMDMSLVFEEDITNVSKKQFFDLDKNQETGIVTLKRAK